MKSRNDIVFQTVAYLECQFLTVFALARLYGEMSCTRKECDEDKDLWIRKGCIPTHLMDFCLDILSKRMEVDFDTNVMSEIIKKNFDMTWVGDEEEDEEEEDGATE